MKPYFLIILFALFSLHDLLAAENCKRVNLLYKKWGLFPRQMPLYDQGKTGICYAFAASQMVDYWRETNGLRLKNMKMGQSTPVYAALLARIYGEKSIMSGKHTLDGGKVLDSLIAVKKSGMCNEQVVKKSIEKFTKKKNVNINHFLYEVQRYLTFHEPGVSLGNYFLAPFESLRKRFNAPDINFDKVSTAMKPYTKNRNFVGFMKDLFSECFKKENIYLNSKKIPDVETQHVDRGATILTHKVKELLDSKNPQPIGISYCENILGDKNFQGIWIGAERPMPKRGCYGHASIIVGKRERGGQCQFLVRNTYGTHCNYDWDCAQNKKKETIGIWVNAKRLMQNTKKIYYFKKP